jgi:hypothetical protein
MEYIKYICTNCGYESESPGSCPECQSELLASCPVCKNPIIGEQINP